MAETIGLVDCLNVGDDFAFVGVRDDDGVLEALILWFAPSRPTASTRLLHNQWLSLLGDALSDQRRVVLVHGDDSAFVRSVRVVASQPASQVVDLPNVATEMLT